MQKQTLFKKINIIYTHTQSKRAKRVRITIHPNSKIIVTTPVGFFASRTAEKFVQRKGDWILAKLSEFTPYRNVEIKKFTKKDFFKYKEQAREFVEKRIIELNVPYNFTFRRIVIRDQKTRWGSCSKEKNLNFNYKLLFLPRRLAEYIIVHELCHTKELNHSSKFWNLVAQSFPDYKKLRKELAVQSIRLA